MSVLALTDEHGGARAFAQALRASIAAPHDLRFVDPSQPLADQVSRATVVVDFLSTIDAQMLDAAAGLRLWQAMGTGTDHIPVDALESRGVFVANCPGSTGAIALAEHAFMLMIMLSRNFHAASSAMEANRWGQPFSDELVGRTLLLIGYGESAHALAVRAKAFGMRVIGVNRAGTSRGDRTAGADAYARLADLDDVLPQADVVSVHLPLLPETERIMDRRRLALLRPGALLINVARGRLVDQGALVEALEEGRLAGAGLDVFEQEPLAPEHELRRTPKVVLTPHVAGRTRQTAERRAAVVAENCDRVAADLPPLHRVRSADEQTPSR